jgi:ubiquinone/menaquinone biosynthesis C-methylase UbiE
MDTSSCEVDRLKTVYREYAERGWANTKWAPANLGNRAIERERERKIKTLLDDTGFLPLDGTRILDVGCGSGEILARFEASGANPENLFGVDLLADRIARAKDKFPQMTFQTTNAESLPFADGLFDLVILFTVFSSILDDEMARNVAREVDRMLRRGGAVLWYDFRINNPFNRHVRGISRKTICGLFEGYEKHLSTITLLPPLARGLGRLTDWVYDCLASLPFLRSHYLGVLVKPL